MKHVIIIIVLSLMLRPVVPVFGYILNYDYIVKELCVNKAKPQLHCNGKCHLKKEMAKNAEADKPLSNKKTHQEREVLFITAIEGLAVEGITLAAVVEVDNTYNNLYFSTYNQAVFHPPAYI